MINNNPDLFLFFFPNLRIHNVKTFNYSSCFKYQMLAVKVIVSQWQYIKLLRHCMFQQFSRISIKSIQKEKKEQYLPSATFVCEDIDSNDSFMIIYPCEGLPIYCLPLNYRAEYSHRTITLAISRKSKHSIQSMYNGFNVKLPWALQPNFNWDFICDSIVHLHFKRKTKKKLGQSVNKLFCNTVFPQ